jgi:hypothetical protein
MATLVPTLTLTSSDISSAETLSLSITDSLTVGAPSQGISTVIATATGGNHIIVPAGTAVKYFYAKNIDETNFVVLQTTASIQYARLSPGEFAFFPINDGAGLEARADTASCVLEYAYWTKG